MTTRMNSTRLPLNASFTVLATALFSIAHADIHKCTDENGNVTYQQLPCPTGKPQSADSADKAEITASEPEQREDAVEPMRESQMPAPLNPSSRRPGERLDACKKRYRDQIDEIDAEIRKSYTPAQGEKYKKRLLALTQQLRACG